MSSSIDPVQRRRAWLSAALVFGALLLVPLLAWLILPAPPAVAIPQVVASDEEPAQRPAKKPVIEAAPAPKPKATDTATETAASVRGRVIGPDREPVSRAYVGCTDQEATHTTTERDGTFELPAEAAGCTAIARRPGFGSSLPVKLRAGDANSLQLRAGGSIQGTVVDEHGAPLTKFMLGVERFLGAEGDDEGSNGRARTIENEKGEFTMENATPGKYMLSASVEGRPPARSDLFEVEPGRATTGIRITVPKGATLSGTITDASTQRPIEGARVELDMMTSSGVTSVPSVKSDAGGAYTLEGVPVSGPFSIRVSKDGYRTRTVSGLSTRGSSAITSDVALTVKGEGTGESELGGIGAILGPTPETLGAMVLATTKDSPAERAGLLRLDRIVRIDGSSTDSLTLVDCIQRLRGEPGTSVAVWVKRGDKELLFNITRAVVVR